MKMNLKHFLIVLVAIVGSTAQAADPTDRLHYYQENIQAKDSGVYEHNGFLFVHVRKPLRGSASLMRVRIKAIGEVEDLLRRWVIDYATSNKADVVHLGYGLSVAVKVLDDANPQWRYADWKYRANGQEVTGSKGGQFWLCKVIARDCVIKQIPESFYRDDFSTNLTMRAISTLVPVMMKTDCRRLYSSVGAVDLADLKVADEAVLSDERRVESLIEEYKASEFYLSVKNQMKRCEAGNDVIEWKDVFESPTEQQLESVQVVTNVIALGAVQTNVVNRRERDEESRAFGISANKMMHEEMRASDEAEIVETKTVSTVTTKKTIRRRIVKTIRGNPQFERVFLSGGAETNVLTAQMASGVAAANLYFSSDATVEACEKAIHDAICENPGDVQLWNMYGRCLLKRGDDVGALICFRAAAKLARNDQFALANLAEAYEKLGCRRIACGYAILGLGLTKHEWCLKKCREVLLK